LGYIGLIKAPSLSLADPPVLPPVAATAIGRGGYTGTIMAPRSRRS
jgi:ribose transport system permease protein